MSKDNWEEYFEDYYFGRLDEKSREAFENALAEDAQLQKSYRDFESIIQAGELSSIKDELREKPEVKEFLESNYKGTKKPFRIMPLVVVSLLILAAVIYFFVIGVGEPQEGQLELEKEDIEEVQSMETDEEEIPTEQPIEMPGDEDAEMIEDQPTQEEGVDDADPIALVNEFLEKSYSEDILTRGSGATQSDDEGHIHECIPFIRNARFNAALQCLEQPKNQGDRTEYLWLKSLVHVGMGDNSQAIEFLEQAKKDRLSKFLPHVSELHGKISN